jgi:hypothetical protein
MFDLGTSTWRTGCRARSVLFKVHLPWYFVCYATMAKLCNATVTFHFCRFLRERWLECDLSAQGLNGCTTHRLYRRENRGNSPHTRWDWWDNNTMNKPYPIYLNSSSHIYPREQLAGPNPLLQFLKEDIHRPAGSSCAQEWPPQSNLYLLSCISSFF